MSYSTPVPGSLTAPTGPAALAATLVLAGCGSVISSAPVVTDAHAEVDSRLIGRWTDDDGVEVVITRGDGVTYRIEYAPEPLPWPSGAEERQRGSPGTFEGRLGRLGGRVVVDVQPVFDPPEPYYGTLISGHLLFVIEFEGPYRLRLTGLDADSLLGHLESGRLDLAYTARRTEPLGGEENSLEQLVLHAGTGELRAALETYIREGGVLGEASVLERTPLDRDSGGR